MAEVVERIRSDRPELKGKRPQYHPESDWAEPYDGWQVLTLWEAQEELIPRKVDRNQVDIPLKTVLDLLKCPICLDFLEDTVVVPGCLHRFCKRCIERHLVHEHKTTCPSCRKTCISRRFLRPNKDLDELIALAMSWTPTHAVPVVEGAEDKWECRTPGAEPVTMEELRVRHEKRVMDMIASVEINRCNLQAHSPPPLRDIMLGILPPGANADTETVNRSISKSSSSCCSRSSSRSSNINSRSSSSSSRFAGASFFLDGICGSPTGVMSSHSSSSSSSSSSRSISSPWMKRKNSSSPISVSELDTATSLEWLYRQDEMIKRRKKVTKRKDERILGDDEVGFRIEPCPLEVAQYPTVFGALVKRFVKAPLHAKVMDMKKMIRSRLQEHSADWTGVLNETRKPKSSDVCIYVKLTDEVAFELADNLTLGELRRNYWDDDKKLCIYFGRSKAVRTWALAVDVNLARMEFG